MKTGPKTLTIGRAAVTRACIFAAGDAGAVHAETSCDVAESSMPPVGGDAIKGAVSEHRRDFAAVKRCVRQALQPRVAAARILPDADGAPRWPAGMVGRMLHCRVGRAAVVATTVSRRLPAQTP